MILKLDQWLANAIGKEARISHFDIKVYGGPTGKLRHSVKEEIRSEFSEKFLADADYVLFFKGSALNSEDALEKLAPIVQRALGKASANDLSVSDFKTITEEVTTKEGAEEGGDEEGEENEKSTPETSEAIKYAFVKITIS